LVEEYLAIPVILGIKSRNETFAGASTTMTVEALMPDGKALQCGTSHNLGQGFAKSFNISYKGRDEKDHIPWQTSWGFSTRLIGAMIMVHGDEKGLVLPPRVAENKVVIVPIIFEQSKEKVIKKCKEIARKIHEYNPILDERESYSAGWKFNEWELKGIPIRIEIGPKDIEKKQVTVVRRDNGKKESVKENELIGKIKELAEDIQSKMFEKAKKFLNENIDSASSIDELRKKIDQRKIVKVYMVDEPKIEAQVKEITGGATSRIIERSDKEGKCIKTGQKTNTIAYFSRAY
jgi:prolyl-tRNA synthetase